MSHYELKTRLRSLLNLTSVNEVVEFKEAKNSYYFDK